MKLSLRRVKPLQDQTHTPYADIDPKRTSKLGYFFLVLMVLFGITQGNNLLMTIQDSIAAPVTNTTCTELLAHYAGIKSTNYGNIADCHFSEREQNLGLDDAYQALTPHLVKLDTIQNSIRITESNIAKQHRERTQYLAEYQTALIESERRDTETAAVLNSNTISQAITDAERTIASLELDLKASQMEADSLRQTIGTKAGGYVDALETVYRTYHREVTMHEVLLFFVSILLIFPPFLISWRYYHQARLHHSEYTIIWGGVVATFGFMVTQVLFVFIYDILPTQLLEALFAFLSRFAILWTLVYWLAFILIPAFFGFLIYLIQKKFYSTQAVLIRSLKSGHCPHCSLKITPSMNNCPVCGYTLKKKCCHGEHMTTAGGIFCEVCGIKQT